MAVQNTSTKIDCSAIIYDKLIFIKDQSSINGPLDYNKIAGSLPRFFVVTRKVR